MESKALLSYIRKSPKRELMAALFELARRIDDPKNFGKTVVRPADIPKLTPELKRAKREYLIGLYLNAQNILILKEVLSIGTLNTTRTHPREIFYPAIIHSAMGCVIVHNHPSGCLDPSSEDIEFTQAVRKAGEILGIELYDHVIVAGDGFTSLKERGLL